MTGYTIKKILPDEIILGQSKISGALIIITFIGLIFITLSILTKFRIISPPETFFNMFLGMGIIFTAGSLIFMIQNIPEKISFSKTDSNIIFSENSQTYSKPFAAFKKFLITGKLSHNKNSSSMTYQLNLISRTGSSLLLCESEDKTELQITAESILPYIDIDLLAGGELLHKGTGNYIEAKPVYPPQNMISIKKSIEGETSVYTWNSRKSIGTILLLGVVIFGFNFLFFAWAFPAMSRYNAGIYAGSAILGLMDIVFLLTFLFYLFGSNIVEIKDPVFSYHQHFFGFNINNKSFNRDEIAMITAGFTSDENKITIFTKRGMDIYNELKIFAALNKLNDTSVLMTLIPKVMELRSNVIEIDGTPLYYYEKLYLENEWSGKLKLENNYSAQNI